MNHSFCRSPRVFSLILAFICGTIFLARAEEAPKTLPNIILCMADDQGWGDVAYNGHPKLVTPHLDAMSKAGLRFDRFYAAAPVCSPTRGSVLTGRHPNRFGCFKWGHTLRPQEVTIAEVLKKVGYKTAHFGKWHIGSVLKGSPVNPGSSGFDEWISAPNFFDNDPILSEKGKAVSYKGESSIVTVDLAIEFIKKQSKTPEPFFVVVWLGSPHVPHRSVEEDLKHYDKKDKRAHWLGEITGLDRAVGKLRKVLKDGNIRKDTLFWYTSDNGGLYNESSGGRGRKGSIYEGGLRVPSIIEWPERITKPRSVSHPASSVDILPTLLEVVQSKVKLPHPIDGRSLLPLLEERDIKKDRGYGFWDMKVKGIGTPSAKWMAELLAFQTKGEGKIPKERWRMNAGKISTQYPADKFPGHAAWLKWPWKLHRIQGGKKKGKKNAKNTQGVKYELYNLELDPLETRNLYEKETEIGKSMAGALDEWLRSVVNSLNGKDY